MDKKAELRKRLGKFRMEEQQLRTSIKEYCADTSFPLEDRWTIFNESCMGEEEIWIQRYDPIIEDFIDSAWWDKYETIDSYHIIDWYVENRWEHVKEELYDELERDPTEAEIMERIDKNLSDYKEATLKKFIRSFEMDW